jgi:hypothetical protein
MAVHNDDAGTGSVGLLLVKETNMKKCERCEAMIDNDDESQLCDTCLDYIASEPASDETEDLTTRNSSKDESF